MADLDRLDLGRLLAWYVEAGADEAIGPEPRSRYAPRAAAVPPPAAAAQAPVPRAAPSGPRAAPGGPLLPSPDEALRGARTLAAACADLDALRQALGAFEGCALKHTATNLVFADGNPQAPVMFIGEAPGADEDREGLPFVGAAGKLLDRMLAAAGLDRTGVYITNILPWRPPGNRTPTPNEVTICLPFLRRHIELVAPKILVLVGGTAATTLLGTSEGISRIRGRWHLYRTDPDAKPIPAMPIYHSAFLLRTPARKREAWRDLLEIRRRLREEK